MAKDDKKTEPAKTNEPTQTLAEMGGLKTQVFQPTPSQPSPADMEVRELADKKIPTSGTFVLTQRYYDNELSRMFEAGELITIENQVPGRTWKRYVAPTGPVVAAVKASSSSPVEKDI